MVCGNLLVGLCGNARFLSLGRSEEAGGGNRRRRPVRGGDAGVGGRRR
jgi:hypothetical protein